MRTNCLTLFSHEGSDTPDLSASVRSDLSTSAFDVIPCYNRAAVNRRPADAHSRVAAAVLPRDSGVPLGRSLQ